MADAVSLQHILVREKLLSDNQIEQAIRSATEKGHSLFEALLDQNILDEERLLKSLGKYFNLPFDHIDRATVDIRTAALIPEGFARDHHILPLFQLGNVLHIATANPFDIETVEELEQITQLQIELVLTPLTNIDALLNYSYAYQEKPISQDDDSSMSSLFEMGMKLVEDKNVSEDEIYDLAQEAPIAKLVDTIIKQAITEKASDIHIEPEDDVVKIRFRVDGLLKDVMAPPKKLESAILSRLKILANLDITETRKPQDGRITFTMNDREIDFRVSTVRTISGEKMVLRILDKTGAFVSMEKLGLTEYNYNKLFSLIASTSGIVVVCGPTGSGKTSTLYSALSKINTPEKNIITIEDPVEYNLEGINQIPVNPKIGVDFVKGLTAIVRQDPDVIMIGEVRNLESASIAIQAALTGHLVFTTLHTRNAAGSVTRLMDMGVAPFLLNSALIGVVGQRLVRRICPNCKKTVEADSYSGLKQKDLIAKMRSLYPDKPISLHAGEGCKFCDNSGYRGRTGIFEVMMMNDEIGELIIQKSSSERISDAAVKTGMIPMLNDGLEKVAQGITTVDEIARVLDIL